MKSFTCHSCNLSAFMEQITVNWNFTFQNYIHSIKFSVGDKIPIHIFRINSIKKQLHHNPILDLLFSFPFPVKIFILLEFPIIIYQQPSPVQTIASAHHSVCTATS